MNIFQVISGHTGWVRSVAVEPANKWFATGSADRTIKVKFLLFFIAMFLESSILDYNMHEQYVLKCQSY